MAIDNGNATAMTNYAYMLDHRNDKKEAIKYYQMAIDNGDSNAFYHLLT